MSASTDNVARLARALAETDPYRRNAFRALGLAALASPAEIAERVEDLVHAVELGDSAGLWAFAPALTPSTEALHAAAGQLADPATRFLHECFWFWPLAHPAPEPDAALEALSVGDTDTATRLWSEAPAEQADAALHNLAVYQHVLALEWETDPSTDPAQLAELRASAAELWGRALASPGLVARLAVRLRELADPGLPATLAHALPALLAETLARTHLRLALERAEHDRSADAEEQVRVARLFLPKADAFATLLAETADPLARRLQSCIQTLVASGAAPLDLATALVRSAAPDLLRLQTLLGRPAPAARAAGRVLVLAVLEAALAHQRAGGAEHLVLPHLLYLLDQPATPELAQRLVSAFEQLSAAALAAALAAARAAARASAEPAPETDPGALARETTLRLVRDELEPAGGAVLGLAPASLLSYQARLAAWIVALATEALATGRPDGEAWAREQLARALSRHAAGTPAAERVSAALARLALADSLALSLAGPANTFALDRAGVALDGRLVAPADLTAIRLGADRSAAGAGRLLLAWSSAQHADALYLDQLLEPGAEDPDLERRLREAVDYFLLPPLVARIEAALLAGKRVPIGPLTFTQAGIQLQTTRLLGAKTQLIPFVRAQVHTTTDGCLLVADYAHPQLHPPIDPAATWNALVIPQIIAHFAPPAHGRSG